MTIASTHRVPDDFPTFWMALAQAKDGDTVALGAGTFELPEGLVLSQKLHICGAGADKTVLRGGTSTTVRISAGTMERLAIRQDKGDALHVSGGSPRITECLLHSAQGLGIVVCGGASPVIKCCEVKDCGKDGAAVEEKTRPTFEDCKVHNGKGMGFVIRGEGTTGRYVRCEVCGNAAAGVVVKGRASPTFDGCTVHENKDAGFVVRGEETKGRFLHCQVWGNAAAGVVVNANASPTFDSCKVHDNKDAGFFAHGEGTTGRFVRCEVWGNAGPGVAIEKKANPTFEDCKIHHGRSWGFHVSDEGTTGRLLCCEILERTLGVRVKSAFVLLDDCRMTGRLAVDGVGAVYLHDSLLMGGQENRGVRENCVEVGGEAALLAMNSGFVDSRGWGIRVLSRHATVAIEGCHFLRNRNGDIGSPWLSSTVIAGAGAVEMARKLRCAQGRPAIPEPLSRSLLEIQSSSCQPPQAEILSLAPTATALAAAGDGVLRRLSPEACEALRRLPAEARYLMRRTVRLCLERWRGRREAEIAACDLLSLEGGMDAGGALSADSLVFLFLASQSPTVLRSIHNSSLGARFRQDLPFTRSFVEMWAVVEMALFPWNATKCHETYEELHDVDYLQCGDYLPGHGFVLGDERTYEREKLVVDKSSPSMLDLLAEARHLHGRIIPSNEARVRAEAVYLLVLKRMPKAFPAVEAGVTVHLSGFLSEGGGCRHQAAMLACALQEANVVCRYRRGKVAGRYHALVEVSCSPGVFDLILDPSHGLIVAKKELGSALPGWQADQHINVVWRPRPILG